MTPGTPVHSVKFHMCGRNHTIPEYLTGDCIPFLDPSGWLRDTVLQNVPMVVVTGLIQPLLTDKSGSSTEILPTYNLKHSSCQKQAASPIRAETY